MTQMVSEGIFLHQHVDQRDQHMDQRTDQARHRILNSRHAQ